MLKIKAKNIANIRLDDLNTLNISGGNTKMLKKSIIIIATKTYSIGSMPENSMTPISPSVNYPYITAKNLPGFKKRTVFFCSASSALCFDLIASPSCTNKRNMNVQAPNSRYFNTVFSLTIPFLYASIKSFTCLACSCNSIPISVSKIIIRSGNVATVLITGELNS